MKIMEQEQRKCISFEEWVKICQRLNKRQKRIRPGENGVRPKPPTTVSSWARLTFRYVEHYSTELVEALIRKDSCISKREITPMDFFKNISMEMKETILEMVLDEGAFPEL
jgi:hypothetical protein